MVHCVFRLFMLQFFKIINVRIVCLKNLLRRLAVRNSADPGSVTDKEEGL